MPEINNNHSNNAFQGDMQSCKQWLGVKISNTLGFSRDVVIESLLQRVITIAIKPYASSIVGSSNGGVMALPDKGDIINCKRAMLELGAGRVYVTPKQWLLNQIEFINHWLFCLISILTVKKIRDDERPAVLVYGVAEEALFSGNNDSQFVEYCRSGPIVPLNKGGNYFIESSSKYTSTTAAEFKYCSRPLINLLRDSSLGVTGRVNLVMSHISLLFTYFYAAIKCPQLSLIGKDIAYCRISSALDMHGQIDSIVLTCSQYTHQPIWLRILTNSEVHMIWYSQSWKPITYTSDKIISDMPHLQWIWADTHWVWTNAFADYLRSLSTGSKFEIVGPIVWHLPKLKETADTNIRIVIFDVSPFSDDVALELGQVTNYHNPKNLFAFIDDILYTRRNIENFLNTPIKLSLKTKRGYKSAYDKSYFDYLDKLSASEEITLEDYDENMYSLISSSHLVISYPFSSPAYMAEFLNVPSIFYDPTNFISRHDFGDSKSLINFAGDQDELYSAAISILRKTVTNDVTMQNGKYLETDGDNLSKGITN